MTHPSVVPGHADSPGGLSNIISDDGGAVAIADRKAAFARRFPVHVGVDAGKTFHKLVVRAAGSPRQRAIRVEVSRDGFEAADRHLKRSFIRVARKNMLVGIEFGGHHGFTFAAFLAERGYHVVAVPVQATSRTRSLEDNSPRKDDDKDAAQICNLVASGIFVRAPVLDEWTSALRILITERDRLTTEATRLTNRLRGRLDLAWPEFQTQLGDFRWKTPRTVLEAWPLPSDLAATDIRTARRLIQAFSMGHFRPEEVDALRKSAKMTIGLSTALEARRAEIRRLLARWALVREQEAEIDRVLERLVRDRRETIALLTIPEVSALCAATIVAELGPPETYTSPRQVLKLAGLNLARKQSGTSVLGPVRITKRGRWALRSQLYLLAMRWCSSRGLYREQYLAMVARNGGLRKKAVCAMARKLTPLILHILQTGEPFDEATWLAKRAAPAGLRRGRVPAPSVHHAVTPRRS